MDKNHRMYELKMENRDRRRWLLSHSFGQMFAYDIKKKSRCLNGMCGCGVVFYPVFSHFLLDFFAVNVNHKCQKVGGGVPTGTHHIRLPSLVLGVGAAWDKVRTFRLDSKGRWSWHCVFSFFSGHRLYYGFGRITSGQLKSHTCNANFIQKPQRQHVNVVLLYREEIY